MVAGFVQDGDLPVVSIMTHVIAYIRDPASGNT